MSAFRIEKNSRRTDGAIRAFRIQKQYASSKRFSCFFPKRVNQSRIRTPSRVAKHLLCFLITTIIKEETSLEHCLDLFATRTHTFLTFEVLLCCRLVWYRGGKSSTISTIGCIPTSCTDSSASDGEFPSCFCFQRRSSRLLHAHTYISSNSLTV